MRFRKCATTVTALLLGLTFSAANAASNEPPRDGTLETQGYVIIYPDEAVETNQGTFYPTGPIDEDTVIVIADSDGSLPGDLTETQLAAMLSTTQPAKVAESFGIELANAEGSITALGADPRASRGYTAGYSWSTPYSGNNIWGWDASAKVSYWFTVTEGSNQKAGGQGKGYYRGYNGSDFGVWSKWYGLGTATSNSPGGASVPWGNVVATTQFKAVSLAPPHIATGYFGP